MVLYPTKPPLRYMLDQNVIDRTIKLISLGEDGQIMVYPTMNLLRERDRPRASPCAIRPCSAALPRGRC